jgi:hypothetical protein
MRFTVLTLVTTAAITGSAWSQDTNTDKIEESYNSRAKPQSLEPSKEALQKKL